MIEQLAGAPDNVAAFRASGEVTKEDFKTIVIPVVNNLSKKYDELNYLLLIDTPVKNISGGAWAEDIMMMLKKLVKWNRVGILTDKDTLNWLTDVFSYLAPGEYKGFYPEQLTAAMEWVAGKKIQP